MLRGCGLAVVAVGLLEQLRPRGRAAAVDLASLDPLLEPLMRKLVDHAPLGAEDIAAAVLAGLDRGDEVILPDPAARAAYELKQTDRTAYDETMRRQASRLHAMGREQG